MSDPSAEVESAVLWIKQNPLKVTLAVRRAVRTSGQTMHTITRMTGALRAALRDAGWVWPEAAQEDTRENP